MTPAARRDDGQAGPTARTMRLVLDADLNKPGDRRPGLPVLAHSQLAPAPLIPDTRSHRPPPATRRSRPGWNAIGSRPERRRLKHRRPGPAAGPLPTTGCSDGGYVVVAMTSNSLPSGSAKVVHRLLPCSNSFSLTAPSLISRSVSSSKSLAARSGWSRFFTTFPSGTWWNMSRRPLAVSMGAGWRAG
jgi:hypothetical protein